MITSRELPRSLFGRAILWPLRWLHIFLGLKARKVQAGQSQTSETEFCDATWNLVARGVLIYAFPMLLLGIAVQSEAMSDSRIWLPPLVWSVIVPNVVIRPRSFGVWAFKDMMFRDCFPPTIIPLHVAAWTLAAAFDPNSTWISIAVFCGVMSLYDWSICYWRLLRIYAKPEWLSTGVFLVAAVPLYWLTMAAGFMLIRLTARTGLEASAGSLLLAFCGIAFFYLYGGIVCPKQRTIRKKVAVIGGGWSGAFAVKWLLQNDLTVVGYERRASLGGVWNPKLEPGGALPSTVATSSKHFMEISDFAMAEDVPDFPTQQQLLRHFHDYCKEFDIERHYKRSSEVTSVTKSDAGWLVNVVHLPSGEASCERFDAVIMAAGPQGRPNSPASLEAKLSSFSGEVIHSSEYKGPEDVGPGKRILVVGAGESASDIIPQLVNVGTEVHWSIRSGVWFADRLLGPSPGDQLSAVGVRALAGKYYIFEHLTRRFLIQWSMNIIWGIGGHGVPRWRPHTPFLHQFINKSREAILLSYFGKVSTCGAILAANGNEVALGQSGKTITVDKVVLCTGYEPEFKILDVPRVRLFKKTLLMDDPSLAFVGFARPTLGSITSLAELQARWISSVFAGKSPLPSRQYMQSMYEFDKTDHLTRFRDSSRLGSLVDQEAYSSEVSGYAGCGVRWLILLVFAPVTFWHLLRSPWIAAKYELLSRDRRKREAARSRLRNAVPRKSHLLSWFFCGFLASVTVALGVAFGPLLFMQASAWCIYFALLTLAICIVVRALDLLLLAQQERRLGELEKAASQSLLPEKEASKTR